MSYIINFYGEGNSQGLWSGWPAQLNRFDPPVWVSGSGYALPNGEYYENDITPEYINSNKEKFNLGDGQRYFTHEEYHQYIADNQHLYNEWKTSVRNPQVKDKTIEAIKKEAQRRIVEPMGYSPDDVNGWAARQINLTARFSELQDNLRINGEWSPTEQYEYTALTGLWAKVKEIRNYSNVLESYVNSGIDVNINEGWPS